MKNLKYNVTSLRDDIDPLLDLYKMLLARADYKDSVIDVYGIGVYDSVKGVIYRQTGLWG